jgi:serine/threonine protein kinase
VIGTTLSHFEITAKLGEGGMGEVYRAADTKLGRQVAIKVLPEAFTQDAERLARFEREAKVLASLNHPNIAAIYSFESAERLGDPPGPPVHFLAMELAAGGDLAARLARGPIPVEEALPIALQITEGLEAAHERGIVHRDLKPSNVMVDPATDGVKLLDFGLAKALDPQASTPSGPEALSMSPTLTAQMTQAGVILGTAAYMAPEQARGKAVDKRADIWAFGCILFEMLSGEQPYPGRDVTEILAAVIRGEPDLDSLPRSVPSGLRRLIEHCLRKEPRERLRDIGDARNELEEIRDNPSYSDSAAEGPSTGRVGTVVPWALAGLLAVVSLGLAFLPKSTTPQAPPLRRFAIDLPWHSVPNWSDFVAALSPTGEHIAYNGRVYNQVDAYVRSLDSLESRAAAPARESAWFFFSPDGEWLGLMNGDRLSKVPVHGGLPSPLANLKDLQVYGLSWGPNDDILIGTMNGLYRLPAAGGQPEQLSQLDEAAGEVSHLLPSHLPDGEKALVTIFRAEDRPQIAVVDLANGSLSPLPINGVAAVYASSGHLIFRQRSTAMAVPFDLDSLALEGDPTPVLENVESGPWVANDGTMLYIPLRGDSNARLVWTDRTGRATPVDDEPRDYSHLDLASDGQTALLNVGSDVYALDLARGTRQLLASGALFPTFTTDNRHATYRSSEGIFRQLADGGGEIEALADSEALALEIGGDIRATGTTVPTSWNSRTGELAFFDDTSDIWILQPDGSARPFLHSPANERTGRFSPDGRWLAYVSDETDEYQVYVVEYPEPGRKMAVSIDGGLSPIWSADGTELFFRNGGKLMAAAVTYEPEIGFAPPVEIFEGPYTLDLMGHQRWDVTPNGESFLMVENGDDFRLVVVQNWFEELERLAPTRQ